MMSHRTRTPDPRLGIVLGLAAVALLALAGQALAQDIDLPKSDPLNELWFVRAGTFEVWQDEKKLGTEFYSVYLTPGRDTLAAGSTVRYDLRDARGPLHYEKRTMRISRTLDMFPLAYQSQEEYGGRTRS